MRDRHNPGFRDQQDRERQGRWGEQDRDRDYRQGQGGGAERGDEREVNYGNQNNLGGDRDDSAIFGTRSGPGYGSNNDRSDYGRGDYPGRRETGPRFREDFDRGGQERSGFDQQSGFGRSGSRQQSDQGQGSDYGYGYGGRQSGSLSQTVGQTQGLHRGKGPKGYQRSDERLQEMICERLREDPEIDASEVSVQVSSGAVTFEGTVDSRRTKNAIEDIAEQLDATHVQNNLRVMRGDTSGNAGNTGFRGLGMDSGDVRQKRN